MLSLRADDRVLLLAVPSSPELAAMGRILMNGVVVALGDRSEVDEGRKALAEFENIMLVESDLLRIPWRDQFFTKIVVPPHLESLLPQISAELQRLLAPQGEIVRSSLNV